ncbi:tat (twin-arginine translocation) pathway signal sequence [Helicobacter didelphidarum]|uniref:Tat (Twin-arginine translocation) pathway signal sequence n=1 Tax=Helicobacter didelphidarum TaxID=2040648 RepID=A0A3D8IJB8_9HELI|nr:aldo/keto reductase [Helicobacter didelphidarum]RDU65322.1 tat (twin-arginine translocation) pathway signal sequence [Helicobacter didelphidarum]
MQETMTRRDFIKVAGTSSTLVIGSCFFGTSLFTTAVAAPRVDIQGLFTTQRLNNGVEMPIFGFGAYSTALGEDKIKNTQAVLEALKIGYKHISVFETEEVIGNALMQSGIPRDEIFLSLQLDNKITTEDDFIVAFNESLAKLKTNYVDLLTIFFPPIDTINNDIFNQKVNLWQTLEKLYKEKRVKAIGVTNLNRDLFEQFLPECEIRPMVNQLVLNPYNYDDRLVETSFNRKMQVATFVPFGSGKDLIYEPTITKIAQKYNKTASQVILRWNLQKGYITFASSADVNVIKEYSEVFNFMLDAKDMKAISKLKGTQKSK